MNEKSSYGTEEIKCPFFRRHDRQMIGCEGITHDSIIRIVFNSRRGRDKQEDIFCKNKYENCEIYRMLMLKYE